MERPRKGILATRHLNYYKFLYDNSKQLYNLKINPKEIYSYEFTRILNDLMSTDLFPNGLRIMVESNGYTDLNDFLNQNKHITVTSKYSSKLNKVKHRVIKKMKEFKQVAHKPEADKLSNQIFYNFTNYDMRDFIEDEMNGEVVTNAWVKMMELLRSTSLTMIKQLDCFKAFHMCELPGAFIAATNHFIKNHTNLKYEWIAQSLYDFNNKNMIGDDYGMYDYNKDNYDFGIKKNGNLYDKENVEYYITKYFDTDFFLVTSDCGEELDEYSETKEQQMWKIHWNQFVIGIGLKNTYYIAKLYSIYTDNVVKLIMLAKVFYNKVFIHRPYTTKITSDEIYLVCAHKKNYDRNIWKQLINFNINTINIDEQMHRNIYRYSLTLTYRRMLNVNLMIFILNNLETIKQINDNYKKSFDVRYLYDLTKSTRNYVIKNYITKRLLIKKIDDKDKILPINDKKYGKAKNRYKQDFSV